ncbi:MAG TPA: AraC family transcriptional regulator [Methylovirgula sp.]|nr:AraC family transcriptional regulator [Methylovirgula sp.]
MPNKRVKVVIDGKVRNAGVGEPYFSCADSRWAGFLIEEVDCPKSLPASYWTPSDTILIHRGPGKVRYAIGAKSRVYAQGLRSVLISPRGYEYRRFCMGKGDDPRRVYIELGGALLNQLIGCDQQREPQLSHHDGIQDSIVSSFLEIMKAEIDAGCPSGAIFGESTSLALYAYLARRYSQSGSRNFDDRPRLSRQELQDVADWIRAHLQSDISLTRIAAVVDVSPYRFCRLFKNSVGLSPHQFVMRERITEAKRLLEDRRASIVEISLMLGFSSQSHFTYTFRKLVGVTPGRYQSGMR